MIAPPGETFFYRLYRLPILSSKIVSASLSYVAAVRYMGAHTSGDYIDVTKLPDTTPMILRYHARHPVAGKSVRYVPGRSLSEHPAEWLIVTWQVGQPDPGERRAVGGARYQLAAKFSYSAPSGIGWWLYRRS